MSNFISAIKIPKYTFRELCVNWNLTFNFARERAVRRVKRCLDSRIPLWTMKVSVLEFSIWTTWYHRKTKWKGKLYRLIQVAKIIVTLLRDPDTIVELSVYKIFLFPKVKENISLTLYTYFYTQPYMHRCEKNAETIENLNAILCDTVFVK